MVAAKYVRTLTELFAELREEILDQNKSQEWPQYDPNGDDIEEYYKIYRELDLNEEMGFGRFCVIVRTLKK